MPNLPHGWRMRNSTGEVRGPPPEEDGFLSGDDIGSQSGSDAGSRLDIRPDSEGWEDLEDDSESLSIKCLLCDTKFSSAESMVEHCKQAHDFDLLQIQRQYKLDFYKTIKLVNYIRSEVVAGKDRPDMHDPAAWEDDKYLQPALDDDALLFSLDDIIDEPVIPEEDAK